MDRRSDSNHIAAVAQQLTSNRSLAGSDKKSRRGISGSQIDYHRDDNQDSDSQDELDQLLGPDPEIELAKLKAAASRSHTSRSVTSRLYHEGRRRAQQTQERLLLVREQVLMREMAEMTQKPNITQRARLMQSKGALFAEHSHQWLARKTERRKELGAELEREKMSEIQASPNIDKRSAQLVERLDDYNGPVSGWEAHFAKFCAKKTVPLPPQLFHPNINSNAIRLDVEADITDRLFKDAQSRDQRKKDLVEYVRSEELMDHNTGRPLFTPQSLRGPLYDGEDSSARRRRPDEVTEELLAKGMELEHKKKQQAQRQHTDDHQLTFAPSINKRSAVLAEQAGRQPLYEAKSVSRSLRGPSAESSADSKKGGSVSGGGKRSADAATAAAAAAAAGGAAGNNKKARSPPSYDVNEFVRRNEQAAIARAIRLEQIKQAADDEQQRECSFQPKISKRSHELFVAGNVFGVEVRQPSEFDLQQQSDALLLTTAGNHTSSGSMPVDGRALRFSEASKSATPKAVAVAQLQQRYVDASSMGNSGAAAAPADLSGSLTPNAAGQQAWEGGGGSARYGESPAIAAPTAAAGGGSARGRPHIAGVEEYISTFEKQMFAVLDEWRELEGN